MPYFKFRIKENTWADITVEAKNADDAREALDIYWVDNSHKVRDVMDRNTVCDTEFLAEVTENDESDLQVYDHRDESDSKRNEPPKKAYGRYPYGRNSKVYLVHIFDEFGEQYCQDTACYNFDKALQYISDGVEVARKEGGLKNASAVITDITVEQMRDDVTWYNVNVKFYKNGAPNLPKEKPIKKTKIIDVEPKHAVEEDGKKTFAYSTLRFTKKEAEDILAKLKKRIQTYGCASWLDFAEYSGHLCCNYTWDRYGWRNLDEAEIRPVDGEPDAYNIYFPAMIALDLF